MSERVTVVAEYQKAPVEGINVVSKTLIDDLRAGGIGVRVASPWKIMRALPRLVLDRSAVTVFTHGPGPRGVLASWLLRRLTRTHVIWIATRPDLGRLPGWLKGRPTAHTVICNRPRPDLASAAPDARMIEQPIGIAPERLNGTVSRLWPDLAERGVPVAVHVGHLRHNRGLDRLIDTKARLRDRIEIVVVASPYFAPDPGIAEALEAAGIRVERGFVPSISDVYRSADLYLFPAPPEAQGATELPLSVLEAMACGLPIVSTLFGALPCALDGVESVQFADGPDFAAAVEDALAALDRPRFAGLPPHLDAHRLAEHVRRVLVPQ